MQIKIEIDVKPEELRRFLGLPDVSGLQDDIVAFLRDKVGAAGEFDAASFVKQNLDNLRKRGPWKNIVARVLPGDDEEEAPAAAARKSPRKRAAAKKAAGKRSEVDESGPRESEVGGG
ncbi:hypothetical protein D0B54_05930 [Solimonas sp. K1W22B-7]|uniref:hypothetical protein n=1 Tax=Solimonas sp. K1W22B-7 TaxID=2303331 RepID=UPI000E330CFE|nr:hypothetical protein [Solimonas sp. K1W22B-7]AXQ28247.1 hypothetical protein D0B54_05930 [Solimonas sp. K1W22B-7]